MACHSASGPSVFGYRPSVSSRGVKSSRNRPGANRIVAEEVEAVLAGYRTVGFEAAAALGTEDEWIALRLSC